MPTASDGSRKSDNGMKETATGQEAEIDSAIEETDNIMTKKIDFLFFLRKTVYSFSIVVFRIKETLITFGQTYKAC